MQEPRAIRHLLIVERGEVGRLGRVVVAERALGDRWRVTGVPPAPPVADAGGMSGADGPLSVSADVVLAVVTADGPDFDRFDLVTSLRSMMAGRADGLRPWVVAAVDSDNPLLRVRLAAVGVDRIVGVGRVSVSTSGSFAAAVTAAGDPVTGPNPRLAIGTEPDAVLDYVVRHQLEAAFEPGLSQAETGLSRRAVLRIRREIAELGAIRPSLDRYTGGADRRIDLPTWRDIVTYVNCARGEVDWGDDAWGQGTGPRIGSARTGVRDLELAARDLVA